MNQTYVPDCGGSAGPAESLLDDFGCYLRRNRQLAPATVENYLNQVRPFTCWYRRHCGGDLAAATVGELHRFLSWRGESCSPGSIKVAATALRTWLDWMFTSGHAEADLSTAVGPVHYPAPTRLPKGFSASELASLLAVESSARDRAVLLVLARLALRAREAAGLRLEDIDWRAATVRVVGKGDDHQLMPLTADVGEVLAGYLRRRPTGTGHRQVFLAVPPPHQPLDRNGISSVVVRVARRAGIRGPVRAHRLRHSAATAVLAEGGTLTEAGQLLRHHSADATMVYAAVDYHALARLARPWPAPATRGAVL